MTPPARPPTAAGLVGALALVVACIAAQLLALAVLALLHATDGFSATARFTLAGWLGPGAVLVVVAQAQGLQLRRVLHHSPLPAGRLMLWVLPPLLMTLCGLVALDALFGTLVDRLVPPPALQAATDADSATLVDALSACCVFPLIDGLLYRGLVLQQLLRSFRPDRAVLIAAAIFTAVHPDLRSLLGTFALAWLAGWLALRTQSLWPGIAAHALANALWLMAESAGDVGDLWLVPALLAGAVGWVWLRAIPSAPPAPPDSPPGP